MPNEPNYWILRSGELGLKSKPVKKQFLRALDKIIYKMAEIENLDLIIEFSGPHKIVSSHSPPKKISDLLLRCFGLVGSDPAKPFPIDPKVIAIIALSSIPNNVSSFAVRTKRSGNKEQWTSQTFSAAVGSEVQKLNPDLEVNLNQPDWTIRIGLDQVNAWLMEERIPGPGGLPPGVQGNVLSLIVDEPSMLASWLMMKRGSKIIPHPDSSENLIEILSKWDPFIQEKNVKIRPWGIMGIDEDELNKIYPISDYPSDVPIVSLEPLCGWDKQECNRLNKHIQNPSKISWGHTGPELILEWIKS